MVANTKVNESRKQDVSNLLESHRDVFSWNGELGRIDLIQHDINTGDAHPLRSRVCRTGFHERERLDPIIDDMLERYYRRKY